MKKEARESVAKHLKNQQKVLRSQIHHNKYTMKRLVEDQTRMKRELALLSDLIRLVEPVKKA